jgi:hypothetical protein
MARGHNWSDGDAVIGFGGVDPDIVERFENLIARKGTTPAKMFETMVRSFDRGQTVYELGMRIDFGKYAGMEMEDLIRTDTRYIRWLVNTSEWFRLGNEADRLLRQLEQ